MNKEDKTYNPWKARLEIRQQVTMLIEELMSEFPKLTGLDIDQILDEVSIDFVNRYHKIRKERKLNKHGEYK